MTIAQQCLSLPRSAVARFPSLFAFLLLLWNTVDCLASVRRNVARRDCAIAPCGAAPGRATHSRRWHRRCAAQAQLGRPLQASHQGLDRLLRARLFEAWRCGAQRSRHTPCAIRCIRAPNIGPRSLIGVLQGRFVGPSSCRVGTAHHEYSTRQQPPWWAVPTLRGQARAAHGGRHVGHASRGLTAPHLFHSPPRPPPLEWLDARTAASRRVAEVDAC